MSFRAKREIPIYSALITALLLIAAALLFALPPGPARTTTLHLNTWSVVAVDPATGDVGVAAASCVPGISIDAVAALVPGKGAAATQAWVDLDNRNQVFTLLQEGRTAEEIIATVTTPASDPRAADRQYGAVTLNEGVIQAAGFTGERNEAWAGDRQDLAAAVSVQGNILEGEAVVTEALAAFKADDTGPLTLPDRLLRALEAGSAAGGDKRCNRADLKQTASSAFILVARAGQPPFAAPDLGVSALDQPDAPWLYLSVTEPKFGDNPLIELRRRYEAWREVNLLACSECTPQPGAISSTGGERITQPVEATHWGVPLLAAAVVLLLVVGGGIWFVRWRR